MLQAAWIIDIHLVTSHDRQKSQVAAVNQVVDNEEKHATKPEDFVFTLDKNQYQQLMVMFSNHLSSFSNDNKRPDIPCSSNFTGTCFFIYLLVALTPSTCWMMDSGATRHMF